MTDEDIRAGIAADPDAVTPEEVGRMRRLVNVKRLRERLGMTQEGFAATYHIPLGTLRDWEQRRKRPDAPARALLWAIETDPETMAKLLQEAA
jgi:putative transcriptional regulator